MNISVKEFIIDEKGNKKAVVIPIEAWEKILEHLEEAEDIKAYDKAKKDSSEFIPFDKAVKEINEGKV